MRLITETEYQKMRWKNGKGTTAQIAIEPKDANFPQDRFLWRMSSARIETSDVFSSFPDYQRILVITHGNGVRLNGEVLSALTPFSFSGSEEMHAEMLNGPVEDFGIIYDAEAIVVSLAVVQVPKESSMILPFENGVYFLFCAKGAFVAKNLLVSQRETLAIENENDLELSTAEGATFLRITIETKE